MIGSSRVLKQGTNDVKLWRLFRRLNVATIAQEGIWTALQQPSE